LDFLFSLSLWLLFLFLFRSRGSWVSSLIIIWDSAFLMDVLVENIDIFIVSCFFFSSFLNLKGISLLVGKAISRSLNMLLVLVSMTMLMVFLGMFFMVGLGLHFIIFFWLTIFIIQEIGEALCILGILLSFMFSGYSFLFDFAGSGLAFISVFLMVFMFLNGIVSWRWIGHPRMENSDVLFVVSDSLGVLFSLHLVSLFISHAVSWDLGLHMLVVMMMFLRESLPDVGSSDNLSVCWILCGSILIVE